MIPARENQYVEFKEESVTASDLAEEIVAFANAEGGEEKRRAESGEPRARRGQRTEVGGLKSEGGSADFKFQISDLRTNSSRFHISELISPLVFHFTLINFLNCSTVIASLFSRFKVSHPIRGPL
jgi:hypothetical protein